MGGSDGSQDFSARRALDCLQHAVLVTDADCRIRYANPAAEHLFGEHASTLVGRVAGDLLALVDERTGEPMPDPVTAALAGPPWVFRSAPETDPLLTVPATGERLPVRVSVGVMVDDGTAATGAAVAIEDDAEDRMLRRALSDSSVHDPLTRLVNRAEFEQRLQRLLDGGNGPHALLYVDLDRFREISERQGHATGDHALREITRTFSEMIRSRDTFGRLDGDAFGLLIEHCGGQIAEQIANSLRATLSQRPLNWRDESFPLTVSIGGVLIQPGEIRDVAALLAAAQSACSRAKGDPDRPVRLED